MIIRNEEIQTDRTELTASLQRISISLERIQNRNLPCTRALLLAQQKAVRIEIERLDRGIFQENPVTLKS